MDAELIWVDRPVREDSSEILLDKNDHNFLSVGGVDLSFLRSDSAQPFFRDIDESNTNFEVVEIVMDYLMKGNFDVFCVQGIGFDVLARVRKTLLRVDPHWETASYADTNNDPQWVSHVVFFSKKVLAFNDMAPCVIENDSFYKFIVEEFDMLSMNGLVSKKPVDSWGLAVILKMVQEEDRYVRILSMALPPLTSEKPPRNEKMKLFRDLSLKKALMVFFHDRDAPPINKHYYFVYGSVNVADGTKLQKSSVDEILTSGQLTMILPDHEYGDFDKPNVSKFKTEKLQFFDPERVVPLRTRGMTSFIYHANNVVAQAMLKCEMMDFASPERKSNENPCGGRFLLLLDHEVPTGVESPSSAASSEVKKG